jgi:hypothetical protein
MYYLAYTQQQGENMTTEHTSVPPMPAAAEPKENIWTRTPTWARFIIVIGALLLGITVLGPNLAQGALLLAFLIGGIVTLVIKTIKKLDL